MQHSREGILRKPMGGFIWVLSAFLLCQITNYYFLFFLALSYFPSVFLSSYLSLLLFQDTLHVRWSAHSEIHLWNLFLGNGPEKFWCGLFFQTELRPRVSPLYVWQLAQEETGISSFFDLSIFLAWWCVYSFHQDHVVADQVGPLHAEFLRMQLIPQSS